MNFLALLLGLGMERALTRLFHLREFRWLDPLFDFAFRRARGRPVALAVAELALVALLLVAPVGVCAVILADAPHPLPALLFAVLVLLFSLGPRDLPEELDDYRAALAAGDAERTRQLTRELTEHAPAADPAERRRAIERSICVQANNRMFGVIFWFLVLGPAAPAGAWLFRVTDLMRRRAVFVEPGGSVVAAARILHGVLAWLPGRLMAAAFALAGSFEGAVAGWRAGPARAMPFYERTEDLVERVGRGAAPSADAEDSAGAAAFTVPLMALIWRTLWLIWYPAIAVLTLNDWLR
jgi:membrane protein required for beta-lactamase induction